MGAIAGAVFLSLLASSFIACREANAEPRKKVSDWKWVGVGKIFVEVPAPWTVEKGSSKLWAHPRRKPGGLNRVQVEHFFTDQAPMSFAHFERRHLKRYSDPSVIAKRIRNGRLRGVRIDNGGVKKDPRGRALVEESAWFYVNERLQITAVCVAELRFASRCTRVFKSIRYGKRPPRSRARKRRRVSPRSKPLKKPEPVELDENGQVPLLPLPD